MKTRKAKSIELQIQIPEDIGTIFVHERQFDQIILNLLSNAFKFTPNGGKVGIIASDKGTNIQITVWDTGIGIDTKISQNYSTLFNGFNWLSPRNIPGTGLGLSFSKKLIELHGGQIWVESELGKELHWFTLPRKEKWCKKS